MEVLIYGKGYWEARTMLLQHYHHFKQPIRHDYTALSMVVQMLQNGMLQLSALLNHICQATKLLEPHQQTAVQLIRALKTLQLVTVFARTLSPPRIVFKMTSGRSLLERRELMEPRTHGLSKWENKSWAKSSGWLMKSVKNVSSAVIHSLHFEENIIVEHADVFLIPSALRSFRVNDLAFRDH
jgi:hypothetical protein